VEDAVRAIDEQQAAAMIRGMQARGGAVARTADFCAA
jgi:hypothetical protein